VQAQSVKAFGKDHEVADAPVTWKQVTERYTAAGHYWFTAVLR